MAAGKYHLSPHDGARPHDEEGSGHAGSEDDIDCNQQSRVFLPIDLSKENGDVYITSSYKRLKSPVL